MEIRRHETAMVIFRARELAKDVPLFTPGMWLKSVSELLSKLQHLFSKALTQTDESLSKLEHGRK